MEPPIRIKLYGLVTVTKRGYLIQLAVVVVLLAVLLGIWLRVRAADLRDLPPSAERLFQLLNALPWVVLACAVLVAVEAYVVLRRFARAEAERRSRTPAPPEPPKP